MILKLLNRNVSMGLRVTWSIISFITVDEIRVEGQEMIPPFDGPKILVERLIDVGFADGSNDVSASFYTSDIGNNPS